MSGKKGESEMKIMTDREYRERIREAEERIYEVQQLMDEDTRQRERIAKLEHDVYELKCAIKEMGGRQ